MADYNQYVADLYKNELGRPGDQGEIEQWANALASGGLTTQQVADMIERSPEGVNYDISRVYSSELGRAPDESGIQSWGQALSSGALTDEQFQNMVRQSPEYTSSAVQQYQDLLNKTYLQEVGRTPDQAGMAQWAAGLRSGAIKPEQLPGLFSNTNEGWVYDQYGNLFKRAPDEAAKAWVSALESGALTRDQVLAKLMASPEYVKLNPTKPGVVPLQGTSAASGTPGYVTAFSNYAPMKAMPDPRSQTFGFLYDTIQQRLGKADPSVQQGLLGLQSIVPNATNTPQTPVNWAGGAQQQTPAMSGATSGATSSGNGGANLIGGLLNAQDLVKGVYQSELNRAPDWGGLNSWSTAVMNGMTQQQLVDAIRGSTEYQGLHPQVPAGTNSGYVYQGGPDGGGGNN